MISGQYVWLIWSSAFLVPWPIIFLMGLEWTAPGHIDREWNLKNLLGINIAFMPLEELLFAITFGMYWSGAYEHFTWRRGVAIEWC